MATRLTVAPPRLGTTVSDASVDTSTTLTLTKNTDYRLGVIAQAIVAKFASSVAVADADAFVVSPGELEFNSGENLQLSVISKTAGAHVSLTVLIKQGDTT